MEIVENRVDGSASHAKMLGELLEQCDRAVLCSGWMKGNGVKLIADNIKAAIRRGVPIKVYSNSAHTNKSAVKALSKAGITNHTIIDSKAKYVHSKIYYFELGSSYKVIVGSGNITLGGMLSNEEMSALMVGTVGDHMHTQLSAYWRRLDEYPSIKSQ